ncbi:helix-turn-helix domain-containing protein [Sinorhizobium meliloti]|nr:helix-turn-helix domain-containing protein [Sinorhizobium meliloti]
MARIGYARVSTIDQDLQVQLNRLRSEGCDITRSEKISGGSREGRTELATVIDFLRQGDELVVTRLDRLGRDTRDVLNIVHECEQRGAFVTVLDPHVSTRGEMGQIILTVLGMVAQMERRFIKERQREGIEKAKTAGVYTGGKRRVNYDLVHQLQLAGMSPTAIAKAASCSRMQVYRIIANPPTGEKVTWATSQSPRACGPGDTTV